MDNLLSATNPISMDSPIDPGALSPPSNYVVPKPSPLDLSVAPYASAAISEITEGLGPISPSRDIVKAAMHFSRQDRIDAIAERKRNLELMDCLAAHGISVQDINAFVQTGAIARVATHNLFVESPQRNDVSSLPARAMASDPNSKTDAAPAL